jgi:hypothetical protein
LEVKTAIRQGLRVVPISLDGQVPAGLQSLLESAPDSIEPIISAIDSERASVPTSVLARLERAPSEQLRWLQSQALYQYLRTRLAQMRASLA